MYRAQLTSLRKGLPPARTTLIATLAAIFPIELLSPPDLLYTILAVPLPIPLSSTDPAPPLSLPDHKEVTEDAVATGLGFAAQVVQLLAAYLSKSLVYPITCVGSRSLIRDGISAMVGPRMSVVPFIYTMIQPSNYYTRFPLFSKGVDTYRFEYGVFLLNKDIEMVSAYTASMEYSALIDIFIVSADGGSRFASFGHATYPTELEELTTDTKRWRRHPSEVRYVHQHRFAPP